MDHVDTSGSDLDLDDIDLESGGTTSGEDSRKIQSVSSCKTNSKKLLDGDCSCSYDKLTVSDEISDEDKERLGKYRKEMNMITLVNKTTSEGKKHKTKKSDFTKPCKPPRPPKGPSLDASDMKMLKEITVLNLKRKKMERRRNLKKTIRTDKVSSSWISNLFACLVTVIFLLVIVFQGLLGSRI